MKDRISRRNFIGAAASAGAAFSIVPSYVMGSDAPSNKLNIGVIGVGGRGAADIKGSKDENIIALCDVDLNRAAKTIKAYPDAKLYRDFRVMLDEMENDLDAVIVATPDHTHYVATMAAMERGKHVYCEKPLAHSVAEVRKVTEAARKYKVATQMGNQGHSSEHIRLCREWVADGAIGDVREVHAWSNRPSGGFSFPVGLPRPADTPPVPKDLDWDLWLGPAQWRPYNKAYVPAMWRGWVDFGTGALGDMGCHILDPSFWALDLGAPTSVEAHTTHYKNNVASETYPVASIIRYEFPARGDKPPVTLTWFDGGMMPPRPEALEADREIGSNGELIIGDKGVILHGSHGAGGCRLIPETAMQAYTQPPKTIERVEGHYADWIQACKGGKPSSASFEYGGALTEMVLLGVIAARIKDTKLYWDSEKLEFTNSDEANALVTPNFRKGWTL